MGRKKRSRDGELVRTEDDEVVFGGYCKAWPGKGTDHLGEGRCSSHGGEVGDGGAPEGNQNATQHGAYAAVDAWYTEVATDAEREVVDEVFADYMARYEERHGEPPYGHEVELFRIAVSVGKHIHAGRWAQERPDELDSGNALVDREVHYSDEGRRHFEYKETVVAKAQKRLSTDRRQWLKDLGLLEDGESAQASATGSLASAIEKLAGEEAE